MSTSQLSQDYTLEPVTKKNVDDVRKLRVMKEQRGFIADIDTSLIQASFLPNWRGYVLRYHGAIVGFGSFSEKTPGVAAKINKIMIDRAHQSQGHGKTLLDTLCGQIRGFGYTIITLDTDAKNIPAISLYQKYGFRSAGEGARGKNIRMIKDLL